MSFSPLDLTTTMSSTSLGLGALFVQPAQQTMQRYVSPGSLSAPQTPQLTPRQTPQLPAPQVSSPLIDDIDTTSTEEEVVVQEPNKASGDMTTPQESFHEVNDAQSRATSPPNQMMKHMVYLRASLEHEDTKKLPEGTKSIGAMSSSRLPGEHKIASAKQQEQARAALRKAVADRDVQALGDAVLLAKAAQLDPRELPEAIARQDLKDAIVSQDVGRLNAAVQAGDAAGLDDAAMKSARDLLAKNRKAVARQHLKSAFNSRDTKTWTPVLTERALEKDRTAIFSGTKATLATDELDPAKCALAEEEHKVQVGAGSEPAMDVYKAREASNEKDSVLTTTDVPAKPAPRIHVSEEGPFRKVQECNPENGHGALEEKERVLTAVLEPAKLALQTHLSGGYKILLALVFLLAVVMPTVMWSAMGETYSRSSRFQASLARNIAMLNDYNQQLGTEHSQRVHDVAALEHHAEKESSEWLHSIAALSKHVTVESSDRIHAIAAANHSVQALGRRADRDLSGWASELMKVDQLIDTAHSDWVSTSATVNQKVDAENSGREKATAGLTQLVQAELSQRADAVAAAKKRLETESSQRERSVHLANHHMSIERSHREEAISGFATRVHNTEESVAKGICTYCTTCGGQWSMYMGDLVAKVTDVRKHGFKCSSGFLDQVGERKTALCCAAEKR